MKPAILLLCGVFVVVITSCSAPTVAKQSAYEPRRAQRRASATVGEVDDLGSRPAPTTISTTETLAIRAQPAPLAQPRPRPRSGRSHTKNDHAAPVVCSFSRRTGVRANTANLVFKLNALQLPVSAESGHSKTNYQTKPGQNTHKNGV
jgi:hypothetical protein